VSSWERIARCPPLIDGATRYPRTSQYKGMSLMRVASPRRDHPARLLRAMVLALAALLGACHSNTNTPAGTPVVTMGGEGISADFASYIAIVDAITLTRTDGTLITLLGGGGTAPQEVDFAQIGGQAEMAGAPAAPSGTYTSATMTLDFTNARV